jgi:hypothetical protein
VQGPLRKPPVANPTAAFSSADLDLAKSGFEAALVAISTKSEGFFSERSTGVDRGFITIESQL